MAILHGVVHDDTIADELHQVLVRGNDGNGRAGRASLANVSRDQIVRLVAQHLDARQVEGTYRVSDQRELRTQVVGRVRPVCLVIRIELGSEGFLGFVEHHCEMGRPLFRLHLRQDPPEHNAEHAHCAGRQPVRPAVVLRVLVHRLPIGAENVGRAVDQKDVIALLRLGWLGGFGHGPHLGTGSRKVTMADHAIPIPSRLRRAPLLRAGRGISMWLHGPRKIGVYPARGRDASYRKHAP